MNVFLPLSLLCRLADLPTCSPRFLMFFFPKSYCGIIISSFRQSLVLFCLNLSLSNLTMLPVRSGGNCVDVAQSCWRPAESIVYKDRDFYSAIVEMIFFIIFATCSPRLYHLPLPRYPPFFEPVARLTCCIVRLPLFLAALAAFLLLSSLFSTPTPILFRGWPLPTVSYSLFLSFIFRFLLRWK